MVLRNETGDVKGAQPGGNFAGFKDNDVQLMSTMFSSYISETSKPNEGDSQSSSRLVSTYTQGKSVTNC